MESILNRILSGLVKAILGNTKDRFILLGLIVFCWIGLNNRITNLTIWTAIGLCIFLYLKGENKR